MSSRHELLRDFVNNQVLEITKYAIEKMPERMDKGLALVYKERQLDYLQWLLDNALKSNGYYIDEALEVMQALESGCSVKEAFDLFSDKEGAHAALVRSFVLSWSKRGPEFFKGSLDFPFSNLPRETQREIKELENNNQRFAAAEKETTAETQSHK